MRLIQKIGEAPSNRHKIKNNQCSKLCAGCRGDNKFKYDNVLSLRLSTFYSLRFCSACSL